MLLVDERSQQRMARPVQGDRKATETQITPLYNCRKASQNAKNFERDGLQQQNTTSSHKQKDKNAVATRSPNLDSLRLGEKA